MSHPIRPLLIATAASLSLLTSCGKDSAAPCDCPALVLTRDPLDGYQQEGVYPVYLRPSFDPAGTGQFAYIKGGGDGNSPLNGLWRSDLATRAQQQLVQDRYVTDLAWGRQGRIAWTYGAAQIKVVNNTGDSLRYLTYGATHYRPVWAPDGRQLACWLQGNTQQGIAVVDEAGRQTDFISTRTGYPLAWSPDGTKLAVEYTPGPTEQGLGIYNFTTRQVELVASSYNEHYSTGLISGADWLPDSRTVVWTTGEGVFKTDIQTRQTTKLRSGCNARRYLSPSISPDGQTILVERNDKELIKNGSTIRSSANLWTMNLDGSNERKVEF